MRASAPPARTPASKCTSSARPSKRRAGISAFMRPRLVAPRHRHPPAERAGRARGGHHQHRPLGLEQRRCGMRRAWPGRPEVRAGDHDEVGPAAPRRRPRRRCRPRRAALATGSVLRRCAAGGWPATSKHPHACPIRTARRGRRRNSGPGAPGCPDTTRITSDMAPLSSSVAHQHRQIGVRQHIAGDAAQDQLTPALWV